MFEAYQITIVKRSGQVEGGFDPRVDLPASCIRFAPRQDALMTGEVSLPDIRVVRFTRIGEQRDAIDEYAEGNAVKIVFSDGEVLVGRACPVPVGGGLWLRPDGQSRDHLLLFVPDGAAKDVEWVSGKPPGAEMLPPPPVASAPSEDQKTSAGVSPIHSDPAEDATSVELDVLRSSEYRPLKPDAIGGSPAAPLHDPSLEEVELSGVVTATDTVAPHDLASEDDESEDCAFDEEATLKGAPPPLDAIARAKAPHPLPPESDDTLQNRVQKPIHSDDEDDSIGFADTAESNPIKRGT